MISKTAANITILSVILALAGCSKKYTPGAGAPTTPVGEADLLIAQIPGYLAEEMFISADNTVTRLNELKPNLPADYEEKIDKIKKAVDAEKAKAKK